MSKERKDSIVELEKNVNLVYLEFIHLFPQNAFLNQLGLSSPNLSMKKGFFEKIIKNINLGELQTIRSQSDLINIVSDSHSVTIFSSNLLIYFDSNQFLVRYFINIPNVQVSLETLVQPKLHPNQRMLYEEMLNNNFPPVRVEEVADLWKSVQILLQSKVGPNDRSFLFNMDWNVNAVFEITDARINLQPFVKPRTNDNFEVTEIGLNYPKFNERLKLVKITSQDINFFFGIKVGLPVNNLFHGVLSTILKPIEFDYNVERISIDLTKRLKERLALLENINGGV